MADAMLYEPTWTDGGNMDYPAWVVYDQSEGFTPAYALVHEQNAQDAAESAEEISGGRLSFDAEQLVVRQASRSTTAASKTAADYEDSDFTSPGYYKITYGGEPGPDGPFSDLDDLVNTLDLDDYPDDGYIVHWDGNELGSVPALFNTSSLGSRFASAYLASHPVVADQRPVMPNRVFADCAHETCGQRIERDGPDHWVHVASRSPYCESTPVGIYDMNTDVAMPKTAAESWTYDESGIEALRPFGEKGARPCSVKDHRGRECVYYEGHEERSGMPHRYAAKTASADRPGHLDGPQCQYCERSFSNQHDLDEHYKTVHPSKSAAKVAFDEDDDDDDRRDDPNRDRAKDPMYGDQTACKTCGMDIEYHGKEHGWIGRGSDKYCDESGAAKYDENGVKIPLPHKLHEPYSDFTHASKTADADDAGGGEDEAAGASEGPEDEAPSCPACGGFGFYMGSLGRRHHFRCRNCGTNFSHEHHHASKLASDDEPDWSDTSRYGPRNLYGGDSKNGEQPGNVVREQPVSHTITDEDGVEHPGTM